MGKILLNPEDGSAIQNVQINGQILFKDKPFEVDTMIKVENDDAANELLGIYEFLKVLETKDDVQGYMTEKKNRAFKCTKCNFATNVEIALKGHNRKHESEEKMTDEFGIEVISFEDRPQLTNDQIEKMREENEKKHLESGGITGGWEDDSPHRGVSM